jgi:hypothetical protein
MELSNDTIYWDHLDGPHMACSDNGGPEYHFVCMFVQFFLGPAYVLIGLIAMISALRLLKAERLLQSRISCDDVDTKGNNKTGAESLETGEYRRRRQSAAAAQNAGKFSMVASLVTAVGLIGGGINFSIGSQTYPSAHPLGQVNDLTIAVMYSASAYANLVQRQGAIWFDSRTRGQGANTARADTRATVRDTLAKWFNKCADVVHGPLNVPIFFGCAVLVTTGHLSRPSFLFGAQFIRLVAGCRAVNAIITKRAAVLAKASLAQKRKQNASNTKADPSMLRRNRVLKAKTRMMLIHLLGSVISSLLPDVIMLLSGSNFSSRRRIILQACVSTLPVLYFGFWLLRAVALSRQRTKLAQSSQVAPSATQQVESCATSSTLSVVQASSYQ